MTLRKEIPDDVGNPEYGWAKEVGYNQACDDIKERLEKIWDSVGTINEFPSTELDNLIKEL